MTRLRVLGSIDLLPVASTSEDSRPVGLAPRQRRLLAALAARPNTVVTTDALADAVWAMRPPANLHGALHTLVSRFRAALHDPAEQGPRLLTQPPGYVLRVGPDDLDASAFEALVRRGRRELADDPAAAAELFDRALALWRGRAFAELADEEFAQAEATRLEELRVGAIEDAIDARMAVGDLVDAVGRCESLIAEQPLRERPRAQLMRAHFRQGRPADALADFQDYRALLAAELGLEPSPALQELQAAVLRGEPTGEPAPPPMSPTSLLGPAPMAAVRERGNLDRYLGRSTPILGRDAALHELGELIRPGALLTVVGPGGVGKTTLALRAAQQAASRFPDGVWVCDLSALSREANVPYLVTTTLDLASREGVATTERLVEYLSDRSLLLVLDNCEHLLAAVAGLVAALHRNCPGVALLATSRTPLDVSGEQLHPLGPLAVPPPGATSDEIARAPAVRLFADRAAAQGQGLIVDRTNADDVAEVCRRLDGLPLALELAANRTRSMSVADLAGRLSWRFRLLHGGPASGPGRHRTLRAVVDWSYDLLGDDPRRVFEVLSVFAGGFSLADAERLVCAAPLTQPGEEPMAPDRAAEIVLSLADRSMLAAEPQTGGYAMLETIRAYGRERLSRRPYAEQVRRVHAELYAGLVAATRGQEFGPQHYDAAELIRSRFDELRAAFGWAVEHDLDLAARLVGSLRPYLEQRMSAEVGHWAERILTAVEADPSGPPPTPAGLAAVQAVAASGARFSGALDRTRRLAETGLAILENSRGVEAGARVEGSGAVEAAGTWATSTECYLRYLLAETAQFSGLLQEARTLTDRVIDTAARHGLDSYALIAEMGRCLVTAYLGRPLEAAERARSVRERAAASGMLLAELWSTYAHGECLLDVDPASAAPLLDDAMARAREFDDRYLLGVTLVSVASLRCRHGDPMHAVPVFREVVEHWHRAGNWTHQWTTLRNVAELLSRLDRSEPAAVLCGALANRRTSVAASGADARRMDELRARLGSRLGERAAGECAARGARMSDEEVLTFVRDALDAVPPPG